MKNSSNCHFNKVSIIGCGHVGASAAYALLLDGEVNELVLYGRHKEEVIGEQLDLEHGMAFLNYTEVIPTDDYADIKDSDIVVITAGAAQKPGETRLDLAKKNIAIIEDIIPKIVEHAPGAVILIVSNPVDVLTYKANQIANLPHGRIFGSGTTLDTARFRFHLSEQMKVNPRSIHTYILGEHGDTSFPFISNATIGGQRLISFPGFSQELAEEAYKKTRDAAYKIIEAKGATYYAIGVVIVQLVKAILRDSRSIFSVSVPLENYYGQSNVGLSIPSVVGKNGIEQVLDISLSDQEEEKLRVSADALRQYLE
jgi:L-lactate dehydrogenase